jgi:hypothetical protein
VPELRLGPQRAEIAAGAQRHANVARGSVKACPSPAGWHGGIGKGGGGSLLLGAQQRGAKGGARVDRARINRGLKRADVIAALGGGARVAMGIGADQREFPAFGKIGVQRGAGGRLAVSVEPCSGSVLR